MAAVVFQRYLLAASTVSTVIAASATQVLGVNTAMVPLSGAWTIRCRHIAALVQSQDNSAKLQVSALGASWILANAAGSNLFSIDGDNIYSPPWTFPAFNGAVGAHRFDPDQTVSSLDQIGGVVATVFGSSTLLITNTDGAAPHNVVLFCRALLEFEAAGSGE